MEQPFFKAWLSLGSNIGDSRSQLETAVRLLETADGGTKAVRISPVYSTKAWGKTDQPDFLNMAVELKTSLSAPELMELLLQTEHKMGRERREKWGPRTIDIDLLFYSDECIHLPHLHVPHPMLHERMFVLAPLNDLVPELVHPVLKKTVAELLRDCPDQTEIKRL